MSAFCLSPVVVCLCLPFAYLQSLSLSVFFVSPLVVSVFVCLLLVSGRCLCLCLTFACLRWLSLSLSFASLRSVPLSLSLFERLRSMCLSQSVFCMCPRVTRRELHGLFPRPSISMIVWRLIVDSPLLEGISLDTEESESDTKQMPATRSSFDLLSPLYSLPFSFLSFVSAAYFCFFIFLFLFYVIR